MKTTREWLCDYVDLDLDAKTMADALTFSGTEVEHMSVAANGETVFQLEVTSNRVDCLGVLGLARELTALHGKPLKLPKDDYAPSSANAEVSVSIDSSALAHCPHYTAQVIRGVKVGPSPKWLKDRLEAIGCASVNNVVDITNYVMFEYSQPLHAFDLAKLNNREIRVRMAADGEVFGAINHREYKLSADDLVIADGKGPVALAGIMGGANTEISSTTTDVLLESAYFEPTGVKATGRRMDKQHSDNLDSDSRYRFERGVDPCGALAASRRALHLILELAGGEVVGPVLEAGASGETWLRELMLRSVAIERTLGQPVPMAEVERILVALGLDCTKSSEEALTLRVPSFRRDLEREIDLVEEIARCVGLAAFESRLTLPIAPSRGEREHENREAACAHLRGLGYDEIVSDTFVPATGVSAHCPWHSAQALRARNPINRQWPNLRRSLIPSLLRIASENERVGNKAVHLYEMANVTHTSINDGKLMPTTRTLMAWTCTDVFEAKGAVESLCQRFAIEVPALTMRDTPMLAKGETATLELDGRVLAWLGMSSPEAAKEFDLSTRYAVCEIDVDALMALANHQVQFAPLGRFPQIERDLAVILPESVSWAEVQDVAKRRGGDRLRGVTFFDEFRGKQIEAGKKSLAFSISFRDDSRTLVSEEVDTWVASVVKGLNDELSAVLRS